MSLAKMLFLKFYRLFSNRDFVSRKASFVAVSCRQGDQTSVEEQAFLPFLLRGTIRFLVTSVHIVA